MNITALPNSFLNRADKCRTILLLCWSAIQLFLLIRNGIETGGEAGKYIDEAEALLNGDGLSGRNMTFYIVQISLIALGLKLKLGFLLPLIIQLLLNLVSTLAFYRLAVAFSDRISGLVAGLALIFFYPYQEFNTFLQTESIYYSLLIIYTSYLLSIEKFRTWNVTILLILITLLTFTRPTGILIVIPTYVYFHVQFFRYQPVSTRLTIVAGIAAVFIIVVNSAMTSGGDLNFLLPLVQEHIICGVPTNLLDAPVNLASNNNLAGIASYVLEHPGQFTALAFKRSIAFFGLKRDYYSTIHNLCVMMVFFTSYAFSALALAAWFRKNVPAICYILAAVMITWVTAILTCDDWHNRFILAMFPLFLLMSVKTIAVLVQRFLKR